MRILVFTPYGKNRLENNLVHLIASYLNTVYPEIEQIICDGVFSACSRDLKSEFTSPSNCQKCIKEQNSFVKWSELNPLLLSDMISSSDLVSAKEKAFSYGKLKDPDISSIIGDENLGHNELLSVGLSLNAAKKIISSRVPDLIILADKNDLITKSFSHVFKNKNIKHVIFDSSENESEVNIYRSTDQKSITTQIVLNNLLEARSDAITWPAEVMSVVVEVTEFLGIESGQLTLPFSGE